MKRKRVWRYYCDHCGKGGCSASHMTHHERHCTTNPKRECGMCQFMGEVQPNGDTVRAAVPDVTGMGFLAAIAAVKAALPAIREAANNCPVCILAALRTKPLPPLVGPDVFEFKKELKERFEQAKTDHRDSEPPTYEY